MEFDKRKIFDLVEKEGQNLPWLKDSIVMLHKGGSYLYGTNHEKSDMDVRGVCIPPKDYWIGCKRFEQFEYKSNDMDVVIYDVRKWLNLAVAMNPNVLETAFAKNDAVLFNKISWNYISEIYRRDLINQNAYNGYLGYSHSQIKKLQIKQDNKTGRTALVEEFGFDTKFLSHAFRLLRQGRELLSTGNIEFPRPDREELKDIIFGRKYGREDLQKAHDDWKEEEVLLKEAFDKSVLPKTWDVNKVNELFIKIYESYVKA